MPIRNPFAKRVAVEPGSADDRLATQSPGFERADTQGSRTSSAVSIKSKKNEEPDEYKLSVVNDSGVYLPPSPTERKGFWNRRQPSSTSTSTSRSVAEIEPFSISRESFDSYRRSFDVSAKTPVYDTPSQRGRQSLDARQPRFPRAAINERHFDRQPPTQEEGFEDVGLNDEPKPQPKRRSFFKLGDQTPDDPALANPIMSRFHFTTRKRAQSGQGAELGDIPRNEASANQEAVEVK